MSAAAEAHGLRHVRIHDAPRLAALERECFALPWSEGQIAAELRPPGGVGFLADAPVAAGAESVDVLGYALFRLLAGEAELLRLAVRPAARRRGLARVLLAAGLDELRGAGCAAVFLEVSEANGAAVALYEREGWRRDGRRPAYYPDGSAALLYRREP